MPCMWPCRRLFGLEPSSKGPSGVRFFALVFHRERQRYRLMILLNESYDGR